MKPLSLYYSNASTMDIEATKLELMQLLLNTQKERVLARLKEVFEQEEDEIIVGYQPNGKAITKTDLIARAEASMADIKAGRTTPIKDFKKELDHWKKQRITK